jgi:hypothetical protein
MINTLTNPITTMTDDESRCWFLVAQLEEMIADVQKEQAEIRVDFEQIAKGIELEKKYVEEDFKFFKNMKAQIDACFVHFLFLIFYGINKL